MSGKQISNEFDDRLQIVCPHCGGAGSWKLLQTLNRCEYCGSALYRIHREDAYLTAESAVQGDSQIIDVLATYDAMRVISQRRAQMRSYDDYSAMRVELGSGFSDTDVYAVRDERKHLFRILESYSVQAPYLLLSSTLVFHVLGRTSGGSRKVYRPLFFTAEDVAPAYGPPWDFRDKGLALSLDKLKAFEPEMQKASHFIAPLLTDSKEAEPARQWKMQRSILTREVDPICFEASQVLLRRWIVFRPYAFVNAQTPDGARWFLIDKQFGTIAGNPKPEELDRIRRTQAPVLPVTEKLLLQIKAAPFRCPECGWDVEMDKRSAHQICGNCSRLLEMTEHGLQPRNYRMMESVSWSASNSNARAWLPFWHCSFQIRLEGVTYDDLSRLIRKMIPASNIRKVSLPEPWNAIFIPAFESWTYDRYDQWAFQTAIHLTGTNEDSLRASLLQQIAGQRDAMIPPVYSAAMAQSLFPRLLPFYFPVVLHSQLNTRLLNTLAQMQVQFRNIELVYVPIALEQIEPEGIRLVGPASTIEYQPVQTGRWPQVLYRTVRRWKAMAEENKSSGPSIHKSRWMQR